MHEKKTGCPANVSRTQKSPFKRGLTVSHRREIRKKAKPEVCTECPKGFAYKRDLDRHLLSHHRKRGIRTEVFECFHCGSPFGERHNLKRHLKKKHKNLHEGYSGLRLKVLRVGSSLVFRGWLEEDVGGAA